MDDADATVRRKTKRVGLLLYEEFSGTDVEEIERLAGDNSPSARLAAVELRAKQYPGIKQLHGEIAWIRHFLTNPKFDWSVGWALTAVERGLALLDHGRFLRAVQMGENSRRQHSDAGSRRRKLDAQQETALVRRYQELVKSGQKYGAIKHLADQFGIQPRTVGRYLKKNQT